MDEVIGVIGAVGGGLAALSLLVASVVHFVDEKPGPGLGFLALAPVAFFVVYGLIYVVLVAAILAFIVWVVFVVNE